jgi:hypothetical protein
LLLITDTRRDSAQGCCDWSATLVATFLLAQSVAVPLASSAQVHAAADGLAPSSVNVLGVGPVDLNDIPVDLRDSLSGPNFVASESENEQAEESNLPASADEQGGDKQKDAPRGLPTERLPEDIVAAPEPLMGEKFDGIRRSQPRDTVPTLDPVLRAAQEAAEAEEDQRRSEEIDELRQKRSTIPPDAYEKAYEQLQRMQGGSVLPDDPTPDPQSWFSLPKRWFASLWPFAAVQKQAAATTPAASHGHPSGRATTRT